MNCPICGSLPISNWIFECRTVAVSRTSDYHVTAECIKIAKSKLLHVASERDALQTRVTSLQLLLDQRWEMMRELEEVCETKDVAKAVEYIKGLKARVNRLEEAGDALQSAVVGVEGMTHWQWLATAHEADLKWRAAKESKP